MIRELSDVPYYIFRTERFEMALRNELIVKGIETDGKYLLTHFAKPRFNFFFFFNTN